MADLAQIGFKADTSDLKDAKIALQALVPAGTKADKAANDLSKSIENTNKAAKRATDTLGSAASATARLSGSAGSAATATARIAQAANQNRDALGRFTKAANDNASAVGRLGSESSRAASGMGVLTRSSGLAAAALSGVTKGFLAAAAAAVSIAALTEAGRGVIETTKNFQSLKASLETVIGSAEKAGQAFEFAKVFAKQTPFDLQQVTEAIIKLKALGLNPTEEALRSFGNTASAMGKPLMQFIEAVADAVTGEFERLKEFGIKASQNGDKVSLTFQGITKTIGNNATEIQKYLTDIGNNQFAGGMDKQAKLLGGSLAAIGDSVDQFKNAIGEGGLAAAVQAIVDNTSNWFAANQDLATSIGYLAGVAVSGLASAFNTVVGAVSESFKWIQATAQVVGDLGSVFSGTGQQVVATTDAMTSVSRTFNESWTATGQQIYNILNGVIGAFKGAYDVIAAQWNNLPALFTSIAAAAANALVSGIQGAINDVITDTNKLINAINSIAPEFAQIGTIGNVSLDGFKVAVNDSTQAVSDSSTAIMQQAMSFDYLGAGVDAVVAPIQQFGSQIADAKAKIDAASDAATNLGSATKTVSMPDLSSAASSIDTGITKPSKEATKALREAEATKKRLLSEADNAVEQFFPFEHAREEAERLTKAINDTSNGLTELQRNALRKQIDQNFIDAADAVDKFESQSVKSIKSINKSIREDIGDALSDSFTDALTSGKSFFKSLLSGFAGLGKQLTQSGFDRIFGGLLGTGSGSSRSGGVSLGLIGASLTNASRSGGIESDIVATVDPNSFAKASGSMLQYAGKFNSNVDDRLLKILQTAAQRFDMPVQAISGLRPGDSRFHGQGKATDVQIAGMGNYQDAGTFRVYERFAQLSKQVQSELFPELEGMLRWGGYFSGGKGKYGALDQMHFDLGGDKVGMGGGSWETGLTQAMRKLWPGADSQGMTKAVQKGVEAGLDPWQGLRTVTPGATTGGATKGLTGGQKAVGAIGAGLGIFSQGMESQSPLMGAVSGALGGFSAGAAMGAGLGPVGAVLGGIVGAVGGLFGKSKAKKAKKKAEREQAQNAWDQNAEQFAELEDEVTRTPRGALTKKLQEVRSSLEQFDKIADKTGRSGDSSRVSALQKQLQTYVAFLSDNFMRDLPQQIADLGKGLGLDTAFTKARDSVMSMADSYRAFMEDIKTAYAVPVNQRDSILAQYEKAKQAATETITKSRDLKVDQKGNPTWGVKYTKTGKNDPAALAAANDNRDSALAAFDAKYGDALQRMNASLEAARKAAIEGLLRLVSGDDTEQSAIDKAMDEAKGAAAGLRTALIDLGETAGSAAQMIDKAFSQRMDKLRSDFEKSLNEQMEDFDGKGYLADFRNLFEQITSLGKDSNSLGLDGSLVDSYFTKAAQALVDDSELVGAAFNDLLKAFPQLVGRVHEFDDAVKDVAKTASQINIDNLDKARDLLDRSYDAEVDKINEQIDAHNDTIDTLNNSISALKSFRDSLKETLARLDIDSNLSPKNAQERLEAARSQFNELASKAASGDEDAQGKLASAGETLLQESRAFWGTSDQYYKDFESVRLTLSNALQSAETQLTTAEKQLKAEEDAIKKLEDQLDMMEKQYNALLKIDTDVVSLAVAMAGYAAAAAKVPVASGGTMTGSTPAAANSNVNPKATAYLAANADVARAIAGGTTFGLPAGMAPEVYASAHYGLFGEKEGRKFATGGFVSGSGNGMSDSIAAWLSNGEHVTRASSVNSETRPILDHMNRTGEVPRMSGNDNGEILQKIADGLEEVTNAVIASGMQVSGEVAKTTAKVNQLAAELRIA